MSLRVAVTRRHPDGRAAAVSVCVLNIRSGGRVAVIKTGVCFPGNAV